MLRVTLFISIIHNFLPQVWPAKLHKSIFPVRFFYIFIPLPAAGSKSRYNLTQNRFYSFKSLFVKEIALIYMMLCTFLQRYKSHITMFELLNAFSSITTEKIPHRLLLRESWIYKVIVSPRRSHWASPHVFPLVSVNKYSFN